MDSQHVHAGGPQEGSADLASVSGATVSSAIEGISVINELTTGDSLTLYTPTERASYLAEIDRAAYKIDDAIRVDRDVLKFRNITPEQASELILKSRVLKGVLSEDSHQQFADDVQALAEHHVAMIGSPQVDVAIKARYFKDGNPLYSGDGFRNENRDAPRLRVALYGESIDFVAPGDFDAELLRKQDYWAKMRSSHSSPIPTEDSKLLVDENSIRSLKTGQILQYHPKETATRAPFQARREAPKEGESEIRSKLRLHLIIDKPRS